MAASPSAKRTIDTSATTEMAIFTHNVESRLNNFWPELLKLHEARLAADEASKKHDDTHTHVDEMQAKLADVRANRANYLHTIASGAAMLQSNLNAIAADEVELREAAEHKHNLLIDALEKGETRLAEEEMRLTQDLATIADARHASTESSTKQEQAKARVVQLEKEALQELELLTNKLHDMITHTALYVVEGDNHRPLKVPRTNSRLRRADRSDSSPR
ncbi:hypothetical protein P153DRAFT_146819 [Dothidotthia symphoricarpi CBS 119687]|uniref:Uncharacterized protein n=1 Tax=Dothidotthia symphoricarpi CBS 119687 TaxID=1392245 RepID=A0A6A5ZZE9_9PLEO|nr:uncharacterized protein P153DRAFT_146819 [Dothidotthia symphoricarpi CBS 119687]KAF2123798.1 hypothetical protein P153DRAFT_146819 [Dothidotthia symphoricarpi CBS 119687]